MSKILENNRRPTATQLFDPLVKVLGRMVGYRAGAGAPIQDVMDQVLLEIGVNPLNSPWPLKGANPPGLYRIIGFAHRNQRDNVSGSKYCGSRDALTTTVSRGMWGLTQAGVEKSLLLSGDNEAIDDDALAMDKESGEPDSRDSQTWVIVELSPAGESRVQDGTLDRSIRRDMDLDQDHPIFIPATTFCRGDKTITIQLMEGYVFIASGLPEVSYFSLERHSYVSRVISVMGPNGIRALSTIPESSVSDMRAQLRGMSVLDLSAGDRVFVVEGKYRGLEMSFLEDDEDPEYAILETVGLRSLCAVTRIPRAFLSLEEAALEDDNDDDDLYETGLF